MVENVQKGRRIENVILTLVNFKLRRLQFAIYNSMPLHNVREAFSFAKPCDCKLTIYTFSLARWSTLPLRSTNSPKNSAFSFSALWNKQLVKIQIGFCKWENVLQINAINGNSESKIKIGARGGVPQQFECWTRVCVLQQKLYIQICVIVVLVLVTCMFGGW